MEYGEHQATLAIETFEVLGGRLPLAVEFEDGVRGVIDLAQDLWGPMFEPLRDPAKFAEVEADLVPLLEQS